MSLESLLHAGTSACGYIPEKKQWLHVLMVNKGSTEGYQVFNVVISNIEHRRSILQKHEVPDATSNYVCICFPVVVGKTFGGGIQSFAEKVLD